MNLFTVSVECSSGLCSSCVYEDCACKCHLEESLNASDWNDMITPPTIEEQIVSDIRFGRIL